jgi:hypothetical protein
LDLFLGETQSRHRRELVSQSPDQRNNRHAQGRGKERSWSRGDATRRFSGESPDIP